MFNWGSSEIGDFHFRRPFQSRMEGYSGLNLSQDKATKLQTVQIVRQGEAMPYWF